MLTLFPFTRLEPRIFYADMNSFYASVEQQEHPRLRGRPVAVVPMLGTDHTCVIAASYQAKKLGIRTGTSVWLARGVSPEVALVEARPELYLAYHTQLVQILNRYFASTRVLSVDEMCCRMPALYRSKEQEEQLARRVKQEMAQQLGECLTCSIGVAPNTFLAKVAGESQKPDGLTIWDEEDLPQALFSIKPSDLPGIGPAMKRRLFKWGITTTQALYETPPEQLRAVWGSVLGERWWYMMRGSHECDYQPPLACQRKSVSHSHVLPPEWRTISGAKDILVQLMAKALKRLRSYQMAASRVEVSVQYRKRHSAKMPVWRKKSSKILHRNDDASWIKVIRPILDSLSTVASDEEPYWVGIVFSGLLLCQDVNLSLFEDPLAKARLAATIDSLNERFGHSVGLLPIEEHFGQVPTRIPFGAPDSNSK